MITLKNEKKFSLKEEPLKELFVSKILFATEKPPVFTCGCIGIRENEKSQSFFIGFY